MICICLLINQLTFAQESSKDEPFIVNEDEPFIVNEEEKVIEALQKASIHSPAEIPLLKQGVLKQPEGFFFTRYG